MPEAVKVVFDYKEVVEALIKAQGIHEGIWMLYVEFGLAAVNTPVREEDDADETDPFDRLTPTAVVPVKKLGIQRAERMSNLAVDAGVVNPKPKTRTSKGRK
jgi:hypothetical protein